MVPQSKAPGLLKNNPFILADRVAKAKVAEPQTSTANVQAERRYWQTELSSGDQDPEPVQHREAQDPNSSPPLAKLHTSRHSIGRKMRQEAHGIIHDQAEDPISLTDTQIKVKKLYQHAEDLSHARHIMEHIAAAEASDAVHTEHGANAREQAQAGIDGEEGQASVPRVRTYSPPSWLRHPSKGPGSLDGRLRRVDASIPLRKAAVQESDGRETESFVAPAMLRSKLRPGKPAEKLPGLTKAGQSLDFRSQLKHRGPDAPSPPIRKSTSTPFFPRKLNQKERNRANQSDTCENCDEHGKTQSPPLPTKPDDDAPRPKILELRRSQSQLDDSISATKDNSRFSILEPRGSPPPITLGSVDGFEVHRPTPVIAASHVNHHCSWKTQYTDLAAQMRQMKAERWTDEDGIGLHAETDEVGIRGLTIVLHLRGKDDLVINTDLTHDAES